MNNQTKICQNCKQNFVIVPEDFTFYERIKVPPPTCCPGCRLQRRLAFWNVTNLYRRTCDLCKKDSVSMYAPDAHVVVYCPQCWWSDDWDPRDYGRTYDFSVPFFEQYHAFFREVPLLGLSLDLQTTRESPYNNHAGYLKNCYLLFQANHNENCAYGFGLLRNHSVFDCSA